MAHGDALGEGIEHFVFIGDHDPIHATVRSHVKQQFYQLPFSRRALWLVTSISTT